MKIVIEQADKNYMSEDVQRQFLALVRNFFNGKGYKRELADFDIHNNTLIIYSPDIVDMQKAEEDFEKKWLIREAKTPWEEVGEEYIEDGR